MAYFPTTLGYVTQFKTVIKAIGKEDLIKDIIADYGKGIAKNIKTGNDTGDDDIADLFNKLLIPNKPKPSVTTYNKPTKPGAPTAYPKAWETSGRSYNVDYDLWFGTNTRVAFWMFTYISTLSTLVPTWTQKLASFFNLSPDKTQAAIKLFQNLNIIVNSTNEDNKKYLFQELAKDADINDIMYVYAATYIKATNVMYHDAVLGYLILNAFWIDGSVVGVNKINKAAPGLYHKTVADWKGSLNKFTTYSAALIQETYKSLESDLQLKDTTIYKPNRFKQTYGAPTAEIQMMVTINEKFNYNCDGDYNNSKYRKGIALAYKSFKITTPK